MALRGMPGSRLGGPELRACRTLSRKFPNRLMPPRKRACRPFPRPGAPCWRNACSALPVKPPRRRASRRAGSCPAGAPGFAALLWAGAHLVPAAARAGCAALQPPAGPAPARRSARRPPGGCARVHPGAPFYPATPFMKRRMAYPGSVSCRLSRSPWRLRT